MRKHPRTLLRSAVLFVGLVATSAAAFAQSAACQRYRAELASLGRGGGGQVTAAAQRQRAEIGRMTAYYRSTGCDRDPFAFFGGPPPECTAIAQRIRMMEANYATLAAQADESGEDVAARRQQLQAAIQQTCQPERPRGLLEELFGAPPRARPPEEDRRARDASDDEGERPGRAVGGRKVVCVRACDGFFFPLSTQPEGRESADTMCQALCPNTEASAFYMPPSGEIENAVSSGGKPYTQLANASKYKKTFDAACACKRDGTSWVEALARAEEMIDRRRDDLVVSAQKAEELSRPKAEAPAAAAARGKEKPKPAAKTAAVPAPTPGSPPTAPAQTAPAAGADLDGGESAPTASRDSAGIGPQSIEGARVLGRADGQRREITSESGAKRTVRTLAPDPAASIP